MNLDTETQIRLIDFISSTGPDEFAKITRRFIYETVGFTLSADENRKGWVPDREALADGYYQLNELCEILDPQLSDK